MLFKKKLIVLFYSLILIISFNLSGCSKDSAPNYEPPPGDPPNLPQTLELQGPLTDSQDAHVDSINNYIDSVKAPFLSFYQAFYNQEPVNTDGATWTWTAQEGNLEKTLIALQNLTTYQNSWTLKLNGTDSDGTTFNDWTYGEGTSSKNNQSGSFTLYKNNTTDTKLNYEWHMMENGDLGADVYYYRNDNQTVPSEYYGAVNRDDNSGEISTNNNERSFSAEWSADGSGEWVEHILETDSTSSGTWD